MDARRAPAPVVFNCVPAGESVDPETGVVAGEIVRLMAPSTPGIYRAFRSRKLEAAGIELDPAGRPPKLKPDQKKPVINSAVELGEEMRKYYAAL